MFGSIGLYHAEGDVTSQSAPKTKTNSRPHQRKEGHFLNSPSGLVHGTTHETWERRVQQAKYTVNCYKVFNTVRWCEVV